MSELVHHLPDEVYLRYRNDPAEYRAELRVDVDGEVMLFGDVMDEWQRSDFETMDTALKRCAYGYKADTPPMMRHYRERPRGHSKTTDIAVTVIWLLVFCNRPLKGYAFAADRDQARLLRDAIQTLIRCNPWLSEILEVQKDRIAVIAANHPGNDGSLAIFTSDLGSSYGLLPDFVVADELTHWEGDGALWHSIYSSVAKRKACLLFAIANAGFQETWQCDVMNVVSTDPAWCFSRLDGPQASWLTPETLDEQRRMLPPVAYDRLWNNLWGDAGGDALTREVIEAAFRADLDEMCGLEPGYRFVLGCDLGISRDHTSLCVLAIPDDASLPLRLAYHESWNPSEQQGKRVEVAEVEGRILELDRKYKLAHVAVDPWQASYLSQRLERMTTHTRRVGYHGMYDKPWLCEVPQGAEYQKAVTGLTTEAFNDHKVNLYTCPPLKRQLLRLRIEEKSYGYRLVSPRTTADGHGDLFSAFALCLYVSKEMVKRDRPSLMPMF